MGLSLSTARPRRFRNLEVPGSARALFNVLRRNGPDSAKRVQAAMELLKDLGRDFADSPSAARASEVTGAVMGLMERRGLVPTVDSLAAQAR